MQDNEQMRVATEADKWHISHCSPRAHCEKLVTALQAALSSVPVDEWQEETAWLVEMPDDKGVPMYLGTTEEGAEYGGLRFTHDVNKAMRFAREKDCWNYIGCCWVAEHDCKPVEHMWCGPAAPQAKEK